MSLKSPAQNNRENTELSELDYINCIICGSWETKHLFSKKSVSTYEHEKFDVVQCRNCGLVYLNPRPSTMKNRTYYTDYKLVSIDSKRMIWYRYLKLFRPLVTDLPKGTVLEFCCRDGTFLQLLKEKYGWDKLYGYDPRPFAVKLAQEKGIQAFGGPIEKAGFASEFFDVIVSRHTIEHLHNPVKALEELHRILKNTGVLIIETPNVDGLGKILLGKSWGGWYIPRHLYFFSPKSLTMLLEKQGFYVERVSYSPIFNAFSQLRNIPIIKRGRKHILPFISIVLTSIAALLGKGNDMVLLCRKK